MAPHPAPSARPARLLAAAVLGAALLTPAPALAAPADADTPPASVGGDQGTCKPASDLKAQLFGNIGRSDAGRMPFQTHLRLRPEQIGATVSAGGYDSAEGPTAPVPASAITFHPELQEGEIDVAAARAVLGIPAGDDVLIRLTVDGEYQDCQAFGSDPDAPGVVDMPIFRPTWNRNFLWSDYPETFDSTWALAPGEEAFATDTAFWALADYRVLEEPQHGQLLDVDFDWSKTDPDSSLPIAHGHLAYRPDEGFAGQDSFVLEWTPRYKDDEGTRVERVTVRVGEERRVRLPYRSDLRNIVWPGTRLHVGDTSPEHPDHEPTEGDVTPEPQPTPDADGGTPPAPAPDDAHEVPGAVETGVGLGWWPAGVGMVAAGAAAVGLRRSGSRRA